MSDLDTATATQPILDSASTSAASVEPVSAASNKRAASPEQEEQQAGKESTSKASKRVKGENGEAVDVKQEQSGAASASGTTNGEGHSAKKMDDDKMEGGDENGSASNSGTGTTLAPVPSSVPPTPVAAAEPPVQQIAMRSLIVTQDASVIIGRGGSHVNEIREKSNARVTVSESIPGNPERILNVSGALDAVAKAFGLIVRRINDEPYDVASVPGSRAVTIKFIIPNSRMGSVIGKGGAKIKEIQEASGARLNASEAMLPGSTERVLSVSGVADAVHIAVYYIGTILLEFNERNPGAATGLYRQQGASSGPRGGDRGGPSHMGPPGGGGGGPQSMPGAQTQQIFIPNALVGAIIGKAGAKINEIRQQSQCQIRVTDPGTPASTGAPPNPEERLVTITGLPHHINTAVQMLYARLEQEKQKAL